MQTFKVIEICAGAGGQSIGLENAGFEHDVLIEIDKQACETLKLNRPDWNVLNLDVKKFKPDAVDAIDLLAGGVPCPPFSIAGKQLGAEDDRDLFPDMIRLAKTIQPKAILIENVKGILSTKFQNYRRIIEDSLLELGYVGSWKLLHASDFGVSQLRPRAIFIALKSEYINYFRWPNKSSSVPLTVGELLYEEMGSLGWKKVDEWKRMANTIAPTLVGGSKKHGGPDLGPTRAKKAWAQLGINGSSIAELPPEPDFEDMPRLTNKMASLVQGFPDDWLFYGKKTNVYRQIGNAFPPPVAKVLGLSIISALRKEHKNKWPHQSGKVQELNFVNTL